MPRKKKVEKEMQVWIIPVQNNSRLDARKALISNIIITIIIIR